MFGVMLIFSYTMLLCIATTSARLRGPEDHPGTRNLKSQASCALDHFYLPNNVLYNHFIMHRLNFDGTH
jgi:hypothetical protein